MVFNFTGVTGWDFYNVRFAVAGGGEKQVENRSGHFTLNNVKPRRVYTLKVQGCNAHFLGAFDVLAMERAVGDYAVRTKAGQAAG